MPSLQVCRVLANTRESDSMRTVLFDANIRARPGQFVMVWLPGLDEVPMTLSHIGKVSGITAEKVGEATGAIQGLKKVELIGVRGPYGNGYRLYGKDILIVAGGSGAASLAPLAELAVRKGIDVTVALGAKREGLLPFVGRFRRMGVEMHIATDDGSAGFRGFVTELAREVLRDSRPDVIYACGKEPMMRRMAEIAEPLGIPVQLSMERYMKCGVGVCGSCMCGRFRICRDGPVLDASWLRCVRDFGGFRRGADGRKERLA